MITSPAFSGKKYAVLGLARSGRAGVEALVASGARVLAWDNRPEARDAAAERAEIADLMAVDLAGFDGIVVSPGVPLNRHPIAAKAREAGVPIIGDIELFALARPSLPPHKVVGITGTNGKSTTTALIHHILRTAGIPATMAGNIGNPILAQDPLPAGGVYVLELSSYQLDLTHSLDCDVAVLLNVTPDHLDRYDSFEAYRNSKLRLFRMQSSGHTGVVGIDDPALKAMAMDMVGGPGSFAWIRSADVSDHPHRSRWPALQGPHNAQNVAAALAAAADLGVHYDVRTAALETFPGLPHRMELVGEKDGIRYINDSKATNADAAAPALAAFPAVHWILGGLAKTDNLGPCEAQLGHVRAAYTIGEAGPLFARLLEGKVAVRQCEMLIEAVQCAADAAAPGEVVLLSPACASFDQFRDYEARGEAFRAAVEALDERVGA
jgi:UDP-N-acetylmuramoylalanine--D-glutamate ligase